MVFNSDLFNELLVAAENSPRLRINFDLRNSSEDKSQRMLNALIPGTVIPIHRHLSSSESVVILSGCVKEIFYNNDGEKTQEVELRPNGECVGINIPREQWHSLQVLEPSVIIEMKDGEYHPLSDDEIMTP